LVKIDKFDNLPVVFRVYSDGSVTFEYESKEEFSDDEINEYIQSVMQECVREVK
jgi:hypothetical protein